MIYLNSPKKLYPNLILINLKLFILFISLFVYKYVYDFRTNQEAIFRLFVVILLYLWVLKILYEDKYFFQPTTLNLPMLLFILTMTISLWRSQSLMVSLKDYILFLFYFFIYFIIVNNIINKNQFVSLIHLLFFTSFLIALYTLVQYYGFDFYLYDIPHLTSTVGQKNWISNYLTLVFPLIFSFFLLEVNKKAKIILFLLLTILYATLMICQSRGIWISIGLTTFFASFIIFRFNLWRSFQKNSRWLIILLIVFIIITIIYSTDNPLNRSRMTVVERALTILDEQDPSINTRFLIWKITLQMIKDKPFLGSGIGTFKINYLPYQAEYLKDSLHYLKYFGVAGEAHNEYLQIAAETGLIGLGLFIWMIFSFYSVILNFLKKGSNFHQKKYNSEEFYSEKIIDGSLAEKNQIKNNFSSHENNQYTNVNKSEVLIPIEKQNADSLIIFGLLMGITCFLFHILFTFALHVPTLGSIFFMLIGLTIAYINKISLNKEIEKNTKEKIKFNNFKIMTILISICMIFLINILVIKPYLSEIYYFKGMQYNSIMKYDMSLPNFEYSAKLYPYNGRILHALGVTYYNMNHFNQAEAILQKTKNYKIEVNTYYYLGLLYFQKGQYDKAEEEFKYAVYLNPGFVNGYHYIGLLYFQQGKYEKAIEEWKKIFEIIVENYPNKYIILNNIGVAYKNMGVLDEALKYFLEAWKEAPEDSPIMGEIEKELLNIYHKTIAQ